MIYTGNNCSFGIAKTNHLNLKQRVFSNERTNKQIFYSTFCSLQTILSAAVCKRFKFSECHALNIKIINIKILNVA